MFSMIVAMSEKTRGIGLNGDLPWKLSVDLQRFKQITTGHCVVMGRKTWESIPAKFRPLPKRRNIVLSRNPAYVAEGADVYQNLNEVLQLQSENEIFIIGGEAVFREALPLTTKIYATFVEYEGAADTFFPEDPRLRFHSDEMSEFVAADERNSHASNFSLLIRKDLVPDPR